MRLIFFSLVVLNLAIATWGIGFRAEMQEGRGVAEESVATDKVSQSLINERILVEDSETSDENEDVSPERKKLCEMVGPFANNTDAESFVERLASLGVVSVVRQEEISSGESYWVHLPKEETASLAFRRLAEVQAMGVESYVVAKGILKNSVSLGVFTKKHLAEKRLGELLDLSLDASIYTMKRTQVEIWVMLRYGENNKMSESTWLRVLDEPTSQERRQNFCLPVAS